MQNYLGLDFGTTNIGIALAHFETKVALPYCTLKNDETILKKIGEIISKEDIGTIVIGIPTYTIAPAKEYEAKIFGDTLLQHFPVKIVYQDEMFTTQMAEKNLIKQGIKHVSKNNDEEASRIILQEWIDHFSKHIEEKNI